MQRRRDERDDQRASAWRLLDTVGGVGIGVAVMLSVLLLHSASAVPAATVPAAASGPTPPYPGCTLISLTYAGQETPAAGWTRHEVDTAWLCPVSTSLPSR